VRIVTDRDGALKSLIGMSVQGVEGALAFDGHDYSFKAAANEQLRLEGDELVSRRTPGLVTPNY